jgi:hypothetical protein
VIGYAAWWELHVARSGVDFRIFRTAATAVEHGRSPYPPPDPHALGELHRFVYPPFSALVFAPFTGIPLGAGKVLLLVLGLVSLFTALRLLGVSDWRCYGLAALSAPAVNSLALGAITPFLMLGVAAAWRFRDAPGRAGATAALAAGAKLFLWPLGVWLLVTGRLRATGVTLVALAGLLVGGWAVIGFRGLSSYPRLLHALSLAEQGTGYGAADLLHLTRTAAEVFAVVAAALVVPAVMVAARGADGDRRALAVAVVGAVFATPLLWLHDLALLSVPIALYRPRLSGLWFVPLVMWLSPSTQANGVLWRVCLALAVLVVVAARTVVAGHASLRPAGAVRARLAR